MRDAEALLQAMSKSRVLVVGDLMLDEYQRGHVERISPEAPVPIFEVVSHESTLGGAGNVVKNLRGLNVRVSVVGALGEDAAAERILELLGTVGVDGSGIVRDFSRKSTRKARFVSVEHGQQVFRVDEESTHPVVDNVQEQILSLIREKAAHANVIVCSDYLKGVLTGTVLHTAFTEGKKHGIPVIVAPKDSDVVKYRGASILVPNLKELGKLIGTAPNGNGWLADSARSLMATLGLEALLVTRGSQGMSLFEPGRAGLRHVEIPTVAKTVYDVTGAGDTGIAAFAAGIAAGATRETAAHIANIAAGIVVGKPGTTSVTIQEIQNHLPTVDAANGAESYGVSPVSR